VTELWEIRLVDAYSLVMGLGIRVTLRDTENKAAISYRIASISNSD